MKALPRYPQVNMTTTPAPPVYMHPPYNYILGAIFAFLIIFSVSGNLLVLLIIARFRRMRTRTNLLLANMSAIDLLTGFLAMPFSMVTAIHGENWKLGDAACQINGFLVALFIASSIHTLMYLSVHKYVSIRNVFKHSITTKHIILMMIATWVWGFLFATGLVAGWTTIEHKHGATQCGPKVPDRTNIRESSHSIFTSVSCFVIPLAVILYCYVSIFLTFRRHIATLGDEDQQSNVVSAQEKALIQQKKIAWTLIIVMICFLVCCLPYVLYSTAVAFAKNKDSIPLILNPLAYIFLYLASCVNPVIYALRSEAFLAAYRRFLTCKLGTDDKRGFRRSSPDVLSSSPEKHGWRRLSSAIHDAFQLALSRETLTSSARSRQGSWFGNPRVPRSRNGSAPGMAPRLSQDHGTLTDLTGGGPRGRCGSLERELQQQEHPFRLRQSIYRRYSQPTAILEERSSQLQASQSGSKWEKNPETDSGRADSEGDSHHSQEHSSPVSLADASLNPASTLRHNIDLV